MLSWLEKARRQGDTGVPSKQSSTCGLVPGGHEQVWAFFATYSFHYSYFFWQKFLPRLWQYLCLASSFGSIAILASQSLLKNCGKIYTKFTILNIFKCIFSDIRYIHIVVHPSPPSTSRSFSSLQIETLYPLNKNSSSLPLSLWQPPFYFVSINLITLCTSNKWHHTVFVLLDCLISLIRDYLKYLL